MPTARYRLMPSMMMDGMKEFAQRKVLFLLRDKPSNCAMNSALDSSSHLTPKAETVEDLLVLRRLERLRHIIRQVDDQQTRLVDDHTAAILLSRFDLPKFDAPAHSNSPSEVLAEIKMKRLALRLKSRVGDAEYTTKTSMPEQHIAIYNTGLEHELQKLFTRDGSLNPQPILATDGLQSCRSLRYGANMLPERNVLDAFPHPKSVIGVGMHSARCIEATRMMRDASVSCSSSSAYEVLAMRGESCKSAADWPETTPPDVGGLANFGVSRGAMQQHACDLAELLVFES